MNECGHDSKKNGKMVSLKPVNSLPEHVSQKYFQDCDLFVDLMGKGESRLGAAFQFSISIEGESLHGKCPQVHVAIDGALQDRFFRQEISALNMVLFPAKRIRKLFDA